MCCIEECRACTCAAACRHPRREHLWRIIHMILLDEIIKLIIA